MSARDAAVTNAADSIVVYHQFMAARDAEQHDEATRPAPRDRRLQPRRLRVHAPAARLAAGPGAPCPTRTPTLLPLERRLRRAAAAPAVHTPSDQRVAQMRLEALLRGRLDGVRPHERTAEQQAVALVASSVLFHAREDKPVWQAHFERLRTPVGDWRSAEGVFLVETGEVLETGTETLRVAAAPYAAAGGRADARHPHRSGCRGQRRLPRPATRRGRHAPRPRQRPVLGNDLGPRGARPARPQRPPPPDPGRRGAPAQGRRGPPRLPVALVPSGVLSTKPIDQALAEVAQSVVDAGDTLPATAGIDLLLRRPPRQRGAHPCRPSAPGDASRRRRHRGAARVRRLLPRGAGAARHRQDLCRVPGHRSARPRPWVARGRDVAGAQGDRERPALGRRGRGPGRPGRQGHPGHDGGLVDHARQGRRPRPVHRRPRRCRSRLRHRGHRLGPHEHPPGAARPARPRGGRRGRTVLAREDARVRRRRVAAAPARRPPAAAPGVAGHAPRPGRRLGPRLAHRGRAGPAGTPRLLPRDDVAHAPRVDRTRLPAVVRRAAALGGGRHRRAHARGRRSRPARAAGRPPRQLDVVSRGGRGRPGPRARPPRSQVARPVRTRPGRSAGRAPGAHPGRRPRHHAVQRPGRATAPHPRRRRPHRRRGRHGRQVPGTGGARRDPVDGRVVALGRVPRHGLPARPAPPQRRGVPRQARVVPRALRGAHRLRATDPE